MWGFVLTVEERDVVVGWDILVVSERTTVGGKNAVVKDILKTYYRGSVVLSAPTSPSRSKVSSGSLRRHGEAQLGTRILDARESRVVSLVRRHIC